MDLEKKDKQTAKFVHEILDKRISELTARLDQMDQRIDALAADLADLKGRADERAKLSGRDYAKTGGVGGLAGLIIIIVEKILEYLGFLVR